MPRNWASFPPFCLPIIALRVKDTIVRALADTGASQSLIDPHLVKQLGFHEEGTGSFVGIGTKSIQVPLVSVAGAMVGNCRLITFKAGVLDLTNLRIGIQLILGINAFRNYRLQFDLNKGRLYLLS